MNRDIFIACKFTFFPRVGQIFPLFLMTTTYCRLHFCVCRRQKNALHVFRKDFPSHFVLEKATGNRDKGLLSATYSLFFLELIFRSTMREIPSTM